MDSWECKKKFTRKYFKKKLQIKKTHEEKLTDQTQTHRPSGVNEERSERSGSRKKKDSQDLIIIKEWTHCKGG